MSNKTSIDGLVHKIGAVNHNVTNGRRPALSAAAKAAKIALLAAPGAPHGKVAGKQVSVRDRMISEQQASVRWQGPAHLVNNPTKAHLIQPRSFAGTRGSGPKARKGAGLLAAFGVDAHTGQGGIVLADGNVRHSVHHPGTSGKHFFQTGAPVAERLAAQVYGREFRSQIVSGLKG